MNVVLIALYRYQNYPIRILHSVLKRIDGIQPNIIFFKDRYTNAIDPPTAREEALIRERIEQLDPDLVGFSVYSHHVSVARRLSALVRATSRAKVVWGGIHPTIFPELSIPEADVICVGEGETALVELAESLRDGKDYRNIRNLWVQENGSVTRNPMRPLVRNLDSLPFPGYGEDTFTFIDADRSSRKDPAVMDRTLYVLPARGCPFSCAFCVNSLLRLLYKSLGPYVRRRSVSSVIEEIKTTLSIPGCRKEIIEFHDENFGTEESWLTEFEERYPREIGLPFKVQYNPSLINPDMVRRLKAAGLHRVKFGIETGTDRIRNQVFGRPGRNRDILRLMHDVSQTGVKIRYDLILDNPYDTDETLEDTVRLLLALPKPLRCNVYSLQFFPGYPLTGKAIADGHIDADEASLDSLEKRMARNWGFQPKILPFTRRQMLQNVIWLYVSGRIQDRSLGRAALGHRPGARLRLAFFNLLAVLRGKIQMIRRRRHRAAAASST